MDKGKGSEDYSLLPPGLPARSGCGSPAPKFKGHALSTAALAFDESLQAGIKITNP